MSINAPFFILGWSEEKPSCTFFQSVLNPLPKRFRVNSCGEMVVYLNIIYVFLAKDFICNSKIDIQGQRGRVGSYKTKQNHVKCISKHALYWNVALSGCGKLSQSHNENISEASLSNGQLTHESSSCPCFGMSCHIARKQISSLPNEQFPRES